MQFPTCVHFHPFFLMQSLLNIFINLFLFFNSVYVCAFMWRSEVKLPKSAHIFYPVGPRNETRVIRLGNRHLYLLSHHPSDPNQIISAPISGTCSDVTSSGKHNSSIYRQLGLKEVQSFVYFFLL